MRTFKLIRAMDVTGVSGSGVVAYGALLPSGRIVMEWREPGQVLGVYDDVAQVLKIHGHDGTITLAWDPLPNLNLPLNLSGFPAAAVVPTTFSGFQTVLPNRL